MNRRHLIEALRAVAERLKENLRIDKYSPEFREQIRDEIKIIMDSADELERLENLENAIKRIFNL